MIDFTAPGDTSRVTRLQQIAPVRDIVYLASIIVSTVRVSSAQVRCGSIIAIDRAGVALKERSMNRKLPAAVSGSIGERSIARTRYRNDRQRCPVHLDCCRLEHSRRRSRRSIAHMKARSRGDAIWSHWTRTQRAKGLPLVGQRAAW